jgi:hypothetical protein
VADAAGVIGGTVSVDVQRRVDQIGGWQADGRLNVCDSGYGAVSTETPHSALSAHSLSHALLGGRAVDHHKPQLQFVGDQFG